MTGVLIKGGNLDTESGLNQGRCHMRMKAEGESWDPGARVGRSRGRGQSSTFRWIQRTPDFLMISG